ncbi:MAG TPA: hypothetical protein GX506_07410 [Firmicutes bacterium]|nr:hypothetical protein [Bacillota bacterium]
MRIPDKVKIGPYIYRVKQRQEEYRDDNGNLLWGEISYTRQEIMLGPAPSEERRGAAFLHEAIHGILEVAGYGDTDQAVKIETIIEVLGTGLYEFLTENGLLAGGDEDGEDKAQ